MELKNTTFVIVIYLLSFSKISFAQNSKDSLLSMSIERMEKNIENSNVNSEVKKKLITVYYNRVKKLNNIVKLANAFYYKAQLNSNSKIGYLYADSINKLGLQNNNDAIITKYHMVYSTFKIKEGKLVEALNHLKIAEKYNALSKSLDFEKTNQFLKRNIAILYSELGDADNTLKYIKESVDYYKKTNNISSDYFYSIYVMALTYNKKKLPDTALNLINTNLKKLPLDNKLQSYYQFSEGQSYYIKKDYAKSSLIFKSIIPNFEKLKDTLCLATSHYYYGKSIIDFDKKNNNSLSHFITVDELLKNKDNYFPDLKDNYKMLIALFKKSNTTKKELYYLNRLIELEEHYNKKNISISGKLHKNYEIPKLIEEKNSLVKKINKNNLNFKIYLLLGILIFIGLAIYIFKKNKENKIIKIKFENLIKENFEIKSSDYNVIDNRETLINKTATKSIRVPEEIVLQIKNQLLNFEKKEGYLDKNVTLTSLAKSFSTNSAYLSKVINDSGKNFSQYLNDLRIIYAINRIKSDNRFRKYSIKAIAEEVGFGNAESFSKTFFLTTDLQPSYFIKEIEKNSVKEKSL